MRQQFFGNTSNTKIDDNEIKKKVLPLHDRRGCYVMASGMAGPDKPERGIFPVVARMCDTILQYAHPGVK